MSNELMTLKDVWKSPLLRARVAAMMWSRTFSGGPVNVCRLFISSNLLSVLLMTLRLASWTFAAMFGTSRSMAHIKCTDSRSSRLMCMWYGNCLLFSRSSCKHQ
ncbi:hypothetical protein Hanom_Chr12g01075541 [Helianthus anomalus]